MSSILADPKATLDAIDTATKQLGFCPNRVWAVAKSLPGGPDQFPNFLPPSENLYYESIQAKDHQLCTFDFCEQSRINFTLMKQRHEKHDPEHRCWTRSFNPTMVEEAVQNGQPTAWDFYGVRTLKNKERYMAISHVWSDGTGTGNQPKGHVNVCLLNFFCDFARQFECGGLWWDTICIPMRKDLREKALKTMHRNYSGAAVTLVNDCFLRGCEWSDAESACFYITMSPWFSRGWTALELKESMKVNVLFKERHSGRLIMKDLDQDILQAGGNHSAPHEHKVAREILWRLRPRRNEGGEKKAYNLNDLVAILSSRHTSWPRDMAIISGLMIGAEMPEGYSHQQIYQEVLQVIGEVSHAHLFHNSATMAHGYNWCPTNLYDLPVTTRKDSLEIEENGNLFGKWGIMCLDMIEDESFILGPTHPLIAAKVQLARKQTDRHILLVEPEYRIKGITVSRALLVKPSVREDNGMVDCYCDYIGPVYFNPPLALGQMFPFNNVHVGYDQESHKGDNPDIKIERLARGTIEAMKRGSKDNKPRKRRIGPRDSDLLAEGKSKIWDEFMRSAINGRYKETEVLLEKLDDPYQPDVDGWSALHHAIWNGRTEVAKLLITKLDIQKFKMSNLGEEPLHVASEKGNEGLVGMLLEHSTVNLPRNDGLNALHLASRGQFTGVVTQLLEKGWDTDATDDKNNQTALHMASDRGHEEVVKVITKLGKNLQVDLKDKRGDTAFSLAIQSGHKGTATLLKAAGADVNLGNNTDLPLLHQLVVTGHEDECTAIRILRDIGVDLDVRWHDSISALHAAALQNKVTAINALLDGDPKARIEAKDQSDSTSLHLAASNDHVKALKSLVAFGADLGAQNKRKQAPLHEAAQENNVSSVKELVVLGANIEAQDHEKRTALHLAASQGHIDVIDALLNMKPRADIDARDKSGRSPLHLAARDGHTRSVQKLKALGADIEAQDLHKWTPLHFAASRDCVDVIDALLNVEPRADTDARDEYGQSPLHLVARDGHARSVQKLKALGADIEAQDLHKWTPLHFAASGDCVDVIDALLDGEPRADTDAQDEYGQSPLHLAAENGLVNVIEIFVAFGADIEAQSKYKSTPLHLAAAQNQVNAIKKLAELGADLKARDDLGDTPYQAAVNVGSTPAGEVLLELERC